MIESTLNYSEPGQAFWSFLAHTPEWAFNANGELYTFDKDGNMYLYGGAKPVSESIIETVVNNTYQVTKVFDNVEYSGLFKGPNFNKIEFKTNKMVGNALDSSDIDEREDSFKIAIPREDTDDYFSGRLKGRYLISKYSYTPVDGSFFSLPYIKTTFRQSNI